MFRLNKFISDTGFCSRREADKLIEQGVVTVNGLPGTLGTKVTEQDQVLVHGKPLKAKPRRVYLAYHKAVGITCTTELDVKGNIIDAIGYPERIFPIGRLDKESEGLIFLTNDGDIVNKILRARNNHEKEYVVTVNKPITKLFIEKMSKGVPILDTVTRPCVVKQTHEREFRIILTQGLNRQIRRMCEYLDYRVVRLKRVRIMNVNLDIGRGKWRDLTNKELAEINQMVAASKKTYED